MTITIRQPSFFFSAAVVFVCIFQHCFVEVQSESVWHKLQDHANTTHIKRQQQKKNDDIIYNYQLFTTTAAKTSTSTTNKVPSPALSVSSTRKGMNMQMSMNQMTMTTTTTTTTTKAPISAPSTSSIIGNTTRAPTSTVTKQPSIAKSDEPFSPITSNSPSAVVDVSFTPSLVDGKMGTMMMSMKKGGDDKVKAATPSPSVSAEPTYIDDDGALSYYPTTGNVADSKGMMTIMSKATTPSPSVSAEPTYIDAESFDPTIVDVVDGKGMGKDKKDKVTSPSPSISADPTYIDDDQESFYPTIQIDSKGGMMSMTTMKPKDDTTFTPSTSFVPSTTIVPTVSNGMGSGMTKKMMMMGMNENQNMMMKKDKDDNMSKMTVVPIPTLPETTIPTTIPNLLPNGT